MGMDVVFTKNFDRVGEDIESVMQARMLEAAILVRNQTVDTLSGQRTGRTYRVPGTKKLYTASAPGEPPAVQLGDLRKSVKFGVEKEGESVVGYVGTDLIKGPMLEFGTKRMAARPWLRVSFEKSLVKVKEVFMRVWF
jgi:hypothetical protein